MSTYESKIITNLEQVVLGELDGHMWHNEFGVPVHIYFGPVGKEIPVEKMPSSPNKLTYCGRIPAKNALDAIVAYANSGDSLE